MGKDIFSALIVIGLCFGQGIWLKENPRINLPMPINGVTKSVNNLSPNALLMQVEGESLQPKTPFWRQAGIYGLEFGGAAVGTVLPSYYSLIIIATNFMDNPQDSAALKPTLCIYAVGNIVLGSSCTWMIGKILNQHGSLWKSAIGSGIGSILGALAYHYPGCDDWRLISIFLIAPPLWAVVGYNR